MFFAAGPLEAALVDKGFGLVPEGPEQEGRLGYGSLARVTDTLDGLLSRVEYVAGGVFTAADLVLAATLGWAMMSGGIERRDSFAAYVGRCAARPAAQAARAKDDALMQGLSANSHG